ncbi:quinone-dependent dihydroorotate dehydrogenase [Demequina aurantiaca]|uniref:quinone-dependent dihydroorotate dehydrogenase n=1 Tax=Demequina aurantiaca TaxID=676200 RepID=UPI0007824BAF|nr:quinone-dependent dihydroorotate dehydrogenase [Demequina aurantiaca]
MYSSLYRHVISKLDAESAHRLGVNAFHYGYVGFRAARATGVLDQPDPSGAVTVMGITFPAPLGLAAGMDKNGESVRGLAAAGFGFVEIGTVTARAQPGNPKPRSWRELDVRGLRNQMGFNNDGADAVAERLSVMRASPEGAKVIMGVNIGKTKATPAADAAADYAYSARVLAPYADYMVVNVSSPNTPGLRDLQSTEALHPILVAVQAAMEDVGKRVPLLVKIAPDLADEDVDAVADLAGELGLDGIVATNTTIAHDRGPGGLSGPPVHSRALDVVTRLRARVGGEMTIIGVGGIDSVDDARALLAAGANLLQTYTGFVYNGPGWVARLNAELTR